MTLQSMTGFARVDGSHDDNSWTWEARSVNGKGLDIRLRIPAGLENLDNSFRKLPKKYFSRGSLQLNLVVDRGADQYVPVVNEAVLDSVLKGLETIAKRTNAPISSPEQILAIKGVMDFAEAEKNEGENEKLQELILSDLHVLLGELRAARLHEGTAIKDVLSAQIDKIEELTKNIINDPARSQVVIAKRLSEQVALLLEGHDKLDNDRLYQEAAILATKADICEEVDRLTAHIKSARELISNGGLVGRKLDFLCQEFNRECNTICSKSNASSVTANGLEMKITIEQFREQVQNIE